MKSTLKILVSLLLLVAGITQVNAQKPALKFNQNGKFKIVQFTDAHVVAGKAGSATAVERIAEVLDLEKPDFVIFTGDITTGRPSDASLKMALEPVASRGIPFGVTWGNHDDENGLTRVELFDLIKDIPCNYTSTTEGITGVTNYTLPLLSADGSKTSSVIYVIDSNSYAKLEEVGGYGWIAPDQIEWYRQQSKAYTEANNNVPLPALAFFHIPLPEYHEAVANEGSFMLGTRKEKACAPKVNSGMALAMLESRDVMAVSVGHDHVNDYLVEWHNIMLCYGRFTGGPTTYDDVPGGNGARVFELTEGERSFKTWITLKDGKVINMFNYPQDLEK